MKKMESSKDITSEQKTRASIFFREYPDIKQVYLLIQQLRNIFNPDCKKDVAKTILIK